MTAMEKNKKAKSNARSRDKSPEVKRDLQAPVELEGWLMRQEGIFKQWKKRWCVVSQYCLFCYEDLNERRLLFSRILPGYAIDSCYGEPGITKQFAFKIAQKKMKSIVLAAPTGVSLQEWIRTLRFAADAKADENDEVFREGSTGDNGRSFPRQLAHRPQSISGSLEHGDPLSSSNLDKFQKRSHSYHNLERSRSSGVKGQNENVRLSLRGHSTGREVSPSRQGLVEQRSRTPIYSPSDRGARDGRSLTRSSGNLNERSSDYNPPAWSNANDFKFSNSNLASTAPNNQFENRVPRSSGSPSNVGSSFLEPQRYADFRGSNRISGSSNASFQRSSQHPIDDRQSNSRAPVYSSVDGSKTTSPRNLHAQSYREDFPYLTNLDDSSKMWKSFERVSDSRSLQPTTPLGSIHLDQRKCNDNDISREVSNKMSGAYGAAERSAEQMYAGVLRPKASLPQGMGLSPGNNLQDAWNGNFQPNQGNQYLGVDLKNQSNKSLNLSNSAHQMLPDHFVSKYDSRPPSTAGSSQRPGYQTQENVYGANFACSGTNFGRSADSLNTLKTDGSSRSSSKNTYYLNNPNIVRKNSYLVVDDRNASSNHLFPHSAALSSASKNINGGRAWNGIIPKNFSTIKEDPNMPDDQVLSSRNLQDLQKKLASHTRLRLSISIQDLMGKNYEEVVLFLIQLKRSQSELQEMCAEAKRRMNNQAGNRDLEKQMESVKRQMEVTQPLINLLDNMLTMGSLFNGDGLMYASQYKVNQLRPDELVPPKAMLEFNRSRQEALVGKTLMKSKLVGSENLGGGDRRDVRTDTSLLEAELQDLHKLDVLLQEHSCSLTSFQQDKNMIERAIQEINAKLTSPVDSFTMQHLNDQKALLEKDLNSTILQLADASKVLEDTTAEMVKSEQRVIHLRNKLHSSEKDDNNITGSQLFMQNNLPGDRKERIKQMEEQVEEIGNVLKGTSSQMNAISSNIGSIKRSRSSHSLPRKAGSSPERDSKKSSSSYLETDLDGNTTRDTALGSNYSGERLSRRDQFHSSHHLLMERDSVPSYDNNPHKHVQHSSRSSSNLANSPNPRGAHSHSGHSPGQPTMSSNQIVKNEFDGQRFNRLPAASNSNQSSLNSLEGKRNLPWNYRPQFSPIPQKPVSVAAVKPVVNLGSYDQKQMMAGNSSFDKEMVFDETTIEKAVFRPPPQVQIPQRYFPDAEENLVAIDPVEIYLKEQKAEQVKKLLAIQSLQDFTVDELGKVEGNINDRIRSELREREELLEFKKNLAKQVTERSRNFVKT